MEVGRNDLCPCGSGKKYKKCCMKKEKVIEIGQLKLNRFFQLKMQLVENMTNETAASFSFKERSELKGEFEQRVKVSIQEPFFLHWLLFFHRDQQGMRGIERYVQNRSKYDDPDLRELASQWEKLRPRLIQHVDYDEQGVFVEDLFSKEVFHMPYCETMPYFTPWTGTYCMLEEFDGGYYINGVAISVAPDQVMQAYQLLKQTIVETNQRFDQKAMDLYPEVLQELLTKRDLTRNQIEINRTELHYEVQDMGNVAQSFNANGHFQIDEWNGKSGKGSMIGEAYRYDDNLAQGSVRLAEVKGTFDIVENGLIFTSLHEEGLASFKAIMSPIKGVKLVKEKVDKTVVPAGLQAMVYSIFLEQGVPQEFAYLAQQANVLLETDVPLPLFDGKTPEEMVAEGKIDHVEQWIRQQEYMSYMHLKQAGKADITADSNAVRRKLGLPLSPFVTLREKRQSSITLELPIQETVSEKVQAPLLEKDDILYMEEIGIPFEESDQFYIKDIIECFKEKAVEKSQSTYYKYRLGLQTISYFLSEKNPSSWADITEKDWEQWMTFHYLAFNMDATMSQVKGFMTVVKSFVAMMDERYGTKQAPVIRKLIKEIEPSMLAAVKSLEAYVPYQERRHEVEFDMDRLFAKLGSAPLTTENNAEGVFQVKSVGEDMITVQLLGSESPTYQVVMVGELLDSIEQGFILVGRLMKEKEWKISRLIRVFPREAEQSVRGFVLQGKPIRINFTQKPDHSMICVVRLFCHDSIKR